MLEADRLAAETEKFLQKLVTCRKIILNYSVKITMELSIVGLLGFLEWWSLLKTHQVNGAFTYHCPGYHQSHCPQHACRI